MISRTQYKSIPAVTLENDFISVKIVPSLGAKTVSLFKKDGATEYLYQLPGETPLVCGYGGDYLSSEMCGIDEMFPTINACHYGRYPWKDAYLPDHGEVWALKWQEKISGETAEFSVSGIALPYRLKKTVRLENNSAIFDYIAYNDTEFDMETLWSGHIMLAAAEGGRHIPPRGMTSATTTYSESGLLGGYGDRFEFPLVQNNGAIYDASLLRSPVANDFQKFYFDEKLRGEYVYRFAKGHELALTTSENAAYIAAINADGGLGGIVCAYVEPCTAPFDDIPSARVRGKQCVIPANSRISWSIRLEVR